MKNLIALVAMLLCSVFAWSQTTGYCGSNVTWTLNDEGTLTISGEGPMTDYFVTSRAPWYNYKDNIKAVVVEDGVTSIGNYAFFSCKGITGITIPSGVTSIGGSAFQSCSSLTSITIPESVKEIGSSAFQGCSKLTSITIPSGVTSIGGSAFQGCSSLTGITIPSDVTSIGGSAFQGCSKLTGITIPSGVTSIGVSAFSYCSSLTSIAIPENVTSIGSNAFSYCSSLTSITIPENVKEIGNAVFSYCTSLTSVTIPSGVTSIGTSTFLNCSSLTSISILSTSAVAYLDSQYNTFARCTELKYVFLYQESVIENLTDIFKTYETVERFFVPDNLLDGENGYRKIYGDISGKFVGFSYLEKEETSADEEKAIALTLDKESYDFIAWAVNNGEQVRKDEEISIVLSEDLDLEAGNVEWKTLGTEEHPFNGLFDGQQHNIKGNSQDNAAQPGSIFGHVGADAEISNVVFSDFVINATPSNGVKDENSNKTYYSLIARNNKGVIRNCVVKGRIEIDANTENVEACLVVDNEEGELDHVVGYFEGLDGEVTGNKASIIVIQNIGHGRTRGSVKKSASNGKTKSKGNSTVSAEVPDDINLNYRLFTNEEFAGPEPAYWLNFDGEGYSGTFTGEWTQGTKHPVAAKGEHGATVGVKYNVVNRDESVLGPSPVFFATSKSSLEVEYSEKPLSIEVNGMEINASQIGDMKAKFSLASVNTDKGNVNVVLKYEKQSTPTAVDDIDAASSKKTIKTVENGRVVIIRDGKKYDLAGRVLSDKL